MIHIDKTTMAQPTHERRAAVSSQLDLLLINPSSRARAYQALGSELAAIEPPVWIGLIATFLRDRGYSVAILDAEPEWTPETRIHRRIGLAFRDPAKTMPIVRPVLVHRQKIPRHTMEILVQVFDRRRRRSRTDHCTIAVP